MFFQYDNSVIRLSSNLSTLNYIFIFVLYLIWFLLGMLYKIIAEASVGTEKEDYLVKAEEALKEAFDLRTTLTGTPYFYFTFFSFQSLYSTF